MICLQRVLPSSVLTHALQRYCDEAVKYIDRDTLHLLFPGLNKLLNFQRKFLIKVESIAELSWNEQRWGVLFSENVSSSILPAHGRY